jgi:hypothetical protein
MGTGVSAIAVTAGGVNFFDCLWMRLISLRLDSFRVSRRCGTVLGGPEFTGNDFEPVRWYNLDKVWMESMVQFCAVIVSSVATDCCKTSR